MPRERRNLGLGVMLLASQLMNVGFSNIPNVTLGCILAQVAIYTGVVNLPWSTREICVSSYYVWRRQEWKRLLLATFDHGDDMHLYYNMVSFLWKGMSLERRYGGRKFFTIIAVFSVAVNVVYVALGELLSSFLDDYSYARQCAVGFSGVLFALKVLTTKHNPNATTNIYGMTLPVKWGVWCELILIQILVPNASFIGHLAGILVGLLYTQGPLKVVVTIVTDVLNGVAASRQRPSYTYHAGTTGSGTSSGYYEQNYGRRANYC